VRHLGEARAVLAALDRLPNADLAYDDWIAVGHALKAALGEAVRGVFLAWSRAAPKSGASGSPDTPERVWETIAPDRCGWRYLARLARGDAR
jgi:hypothetical protein